MIRALVTGRLHDTPQARTSQSGNTFAIAKVKHGRALQRPRRRGVENHPFAPARHLKTTLFKYLHLYNQHIPQKNLGHVTPIAKLKEYYQIKPALFQKKPINHPGPDIYAIVATLTG